MCIHIVCYLSVRRFIDCCGAGMESLIWFCSMVSLAFSALSWYMLVCISTEAATNSGTWTPI